VPVIAGVVAGLTVIVFVAVEEEPQLFEKIYVITVVPAATPVTTPVLVIEPTAGADEDQAPPAVGCVSVILAPVLTDEGPPITVVTPVTVTTVVTKQLPLVKVIRAVPAATPDTTPVVAFTVAAAGKLLDHVPAPELLNVVVVPAHKVAVPVMAAGAATTVSVFTATQPVVRL
jgi:hypothetical protein